MTLILSTIFGILLAYAWEYFCSHIIKKTELRISGWKLHHSLYGVIFITTGLLTQTIFPTGLGIGILIQHTFTDGFRFITKK